MPIVVVWAALFAINGAVIGWREAYDVMIAVTSPAATSSPLLAWPLSLAGWLVGPGIAGAVAGYVVTSSIQGRRRKKIDGLFEKPDHA